MAEVEYSVAAILNLENEATAQSALTRLASKADATAKSFKDLGSGLATGLGRVGSVVGSTIDQLARLGAGALAAGAALGGALAFNEVRTGLVNVNAELEQAKLGIASTFNMLGGSDSFAGGLDLAGQLIGKIREDAAALPGEFRDFVGIAGVLTPDLLNAGKSVQEIRDLTRQTAIAAASVGVNFDQAGREMAQLLEGHAGGHNVLGSRLGITTSTKVGGKDFNEASAQERFAFLQTKLARGDQSLPAFEKSWAGVTSTLSDYRHQLQGIVTGPLFDKMKGSLLDVSKYYTEHRSLIHQIAGDVGQKIGGAWDYVDGIGRKIPHALSEVHYWWFGIRGQVFETAHAIEHGIGGAIDRLRPLARFLGHELEHPGKLLKEIAALRIGAAAMQGLPGAVSLGSRLAGLGGALGGGAEMGGMGALGGAAAAAGPALFAAAGALVAVAAAGVAIADQRYDSVQHATNAAAELGEAAGHIGGAFASLTQEGGILRDTIDVTGAVIIRVAEDALGGLNVALSSSRDVINFLNNDLVAFVKAGFGVSTDARVNVNLMSVAMDSMKTAVESAIPGLTTLTGLFHAFKFLKARSGGDFDPGGDAAIDKSTDATSWMAGTIKGPSFFSDIGGECGKSKVAPAPNVNIHGAKFEIKIDAREQDPDRIIRRMVTKIGEVAIQGTMGSAAVGVPGGAR